MLSLDFGNETHKKKTRRDKNRFKFILDVAGSSLIWFGCVLWQNYFRLFNDNSFLYMHIHIYACVCVCVCIKMNLEHSGEGIKSCNQRNAKLFKRIEHIGIR